MNPERKRIRAVAIIIKGGEILLMYRIKNGQEYYTFPGGGVEKGETIEQAVLREVQEETTLVIKIEKMLYHHIYDNNTEQFFYLCLYVAGTPQLGDGPETEEMKNSDNNFYNPIWCKIEKLPQLLLYPLKIRNWLLEDLETNFANTPKKAKIEISELQ